MRTPRQQVMVPASSKGREEAALRYRPLSRRQPSLPLDSRPDFAPLPRVLIAAQKCLPIERRAATAAVGETVSKHLRTASLPPSTTLPRRHPSAKSPHSRSRVYHALRLGTTGILGRQAPRGGAKAKTILVPAYRQATPPEAPTHRMPNVASNVKRRTLLPAKSCQRPSRRFECREG